MIMSVKYNKMGQLVRLWCCPAPRFLSSNVLTPVPRVAHGVSRSSSLVSVFAVSPV